MDLHHFFEGMVRREEVASAFPATLLEYDARFRREFLRAVGGESLVHAGPAWTVLVEADRVDVSLEAQSDVVLVENKTSSRVKQQGQLLRYYLTAVASSPQKRIAAVYLAPGGMGADEVEAVEHDLFVSVDRPTSSRNCRGFGA